MKIDDMLRDQKRIGKKRMEWGDIGWRALNDFLLENGFWKAEYESAKSFRFMGIQHFHIKK